MATPNPPLSSNVRAQEIGENMKVIIASLALLPSIGLTLGADAVEYLGISPSGNQLNLVYHSASHPSPASPTFYYSDQSHRLYKLCWSKDFPEESEKRELHCGPEKDGKPAIIYSGSASDYDEAYARHLKVFERTWPKNNGTLLRYFTCESGCAGDVANILFEVGHGDDGE